MSKKDAKAFIEKTEKDAKLRSQIAHARNEEECLKIITDAGFHFDEKEYREAFEEKYHHPLKREVLHKLAAEGVIVSEVAAKMPYQSNHPHHGE